MNFFTADWHFNHANILKYCDRPFGNSHEMNECIIRNHNSVVGFDDVVFMLGDITFGSKKRGAECVRRLNGQKILIRGNHDKSLSDERLLGDFGFIEVHNRLQYFTNGLRILMTHDPKTALLWGRTEPQIGTILLCGHIHNTAKLVVENDPFQKALNVGIDVNNFYPISFDEMLSQWRDPSIEDKISYQI